jgi:hypothetical protein
MLKFVSKFFLEIFPSVVATVVGAYIVNHYIMPKATPDVPKAAYSKAVPDNRDDQGAINITPKPDAASAQDAKGQDSKAKTPTEKPATDKPSTEKAAIDRNVDKLADKPVETVKAAPERRPSPRERIIVKNAPVPAEAASMAEEHRDANELARAAIERLRASPEVRPVAEPVPPPEAREPVRSVSAVPQPQPRAFVPPLPPPVNVNASGRDGFAGGRDGFAGNFSTSGESSPSYPAAAHPAEANRPVPPADVPLANPLDLQAAAAPKPSVADNMLSAARSVINAVVPQ